MKHPLEKYRLIAEPNFIFQMEEKFYSKHFAELSEGLYVTIEKDKNRMQVTGVDLEGKDFGSYVTLSSYFLSEYNQLEKACRSEIESLILEYLDKEKQQLLIKSIISELQLLQTTINKIELAPEYDVYRSILVDKCKLFAETIGSIYSDEPKKTNSPSRKIKWLGTNKQLGTLFFDLWKGQKGTSKNPIGFKPILEVDTKEHLMEFIFNNFVNKKGEPLSLSSISDQLNESESKNSQRAIENRIELSF